MPGPGYGPENPDITYTDHEYDEQLFDSGEAAINYATTGSPEKPAIVLIPGQMESWWGYEEAMGLLSEHFEVFAIDLRGQGRSSRTPGRYTFNNFGNDVVRFISFVVRRPVIVSGLSSGGVIAAWLSAFAPPGMIRGAHYEDPPLFSCETKPAFGPSLRQTAVCRFFEAMSRHLGDQWCVGDWEGLVETLSERGADSGLTADMPPQGIKEYDPEWARAFTSGSVGAACDHAEMLSHVKCPILFTHHSRFIAEKTGLLVGACTDDQVDHAERLVTTAGQPFTRLSFPQIPHSMHGTDSTLFTDTILNWSGTLPDEAIVRMGGVFAKGQSAADRTNDSYPHHSS